MNYSDLGIFRQLKHEIKELGYTGGMLQKGYEFTDILDPRNALREIPLAAFAEEPTSYRNAAIGVVIANGTQGKELVYGYRSLGAPLVFELNGDKVFRWRVSGDELPSLLGDEDSESLHSLFARHKEKWSPKQVLRAKSDGTLASQLDFMDLGLLPILESEVRSKVDNFLRDTIVLANDVREHKTELKNSHPDRLFHLIFRLVAAKVLADRGQLAVSLEDDAEYVLETFEKFCFGQEVPEPLSVGLETRNAVWDRIAHTFHFQNLSVDSLAYAYENTLVEDEARKRYGIHSTPPAIAKYIVKNLPFESLQPEERRVFEPFSGHSIFLVAAMQRLRDLLPFDMSPEERHKYFVDMLSGIELDPFAREVAKLSLMLTDFPFPDGWRLYEEDVFASSRIQQELTRANIVLCNPPFESFSAEDRENYGSFASKRKPKPLEVLKRVLENPPKLMGFVLPRTFVAGRDYRSVRSEIGSKYSSVEVLALPDRVFQHSESESALLVASGLNGFNVSLKTGELYTWHPTSTYEIVPSYQHEEFVEDGEAALRDGLTISELKSIWDQTASMSRLEDVAEVRRGIQYKESFKHSLSPLVSDEGGPGFALGVQKVKGFVEPYLVKDTLYLNVSQNAAITAIAQIPWAEPKILVNASRQSRGPWNITASIDHDGLRFYRNFHGVWPLGTLPVEVLAAILNGPLANAYVMMRGDRRYVRAETLRTVPVPVFEEHQIAEITRLVNVYRDVRGDWLACSIDPTVAYQQCKDLVRSIDNTVLESYHISPQSKLELEEYFKHVRFSSHSRLGPIETLEIGESSIPYFPDTPALQRNSRRSDHPELDAALEDLERVKQDAAEDGWPLPSEDGIKRALTILQAMYKINPLRYDIYPMDEGEVVIDGGGLGHRIGVFCYPDGHVLYIGWIDGKRQRVRGESTDDIPYEFLRSALSQLGQVEQDA